MVKTAQEQTKSLAELWEDKLTAKENLIIELKKSNSLTLQVSALIKEELELDEKIIVNMTTDGAFIQAVIKFLKKLISMLL